MKIAFFSKHLPSDQPNGVSVQVHRLAEALVLRDHKVTVFSFSPRPDSATYNHAQLSWNSVGTNQSVFQKKFTPAFEFRKINTHNFDICHYHGDDYLCPGSAKRVRTFYGSAFFEAMHAVKPGRFLYQLLFYKLEWLSCMRKGQLAAISSYTKKALPLVRQVIPCGVPLDRFKPSTEIDTAKSENPSILFIGDFKSRKQGDLLLDVFSNKILSAFPKAELLVVGPEKKIAKNVNCLGQISENRLVEEYRKAWVYCLPSSYEGFGVPAIEAMACGTAVVAVENAGTREIIKSGVDGLLCRPAGLGDSIKKVLENGIMRESLAGQGLEKAKEFDINKIAEWYEGVYKR